MKKWKRIKINDYKTNYEVSVSGEVRNIFNKDSNLVQYTNKGYKFVYLYGIKNATNKRHRKKMYVHRLVAIAFLKNPLNLPCVNHIDHNRSNNDLSNLEWVTDSDNMYDIYDGGYNSIALSTKQVKKICIMLSFQIPMNLISLYLNIPYSRIKDIKQRRAWKRISKDYEF